MCNVIVCPGRVRQLGSPADGYGEANLGTEVEGHARRDRGEHRDAGRLTRCRFYDNVDVSRRSINVVWYYVRQDWGWKLWMEPNDVRG